MPDAPMTAERVHEHETLAPKTERIGRPLAILIVQGLAMLGGLWILFYALFLAFPYLSAGAGIIYRAKLKLETQGHIFPADSNARRILIFGDSKILAGFVPDTFDSLASTAGLKTYSFNSGYPGITSFVPELSELVEKGQSPDVLLLTFRWADTGTQTDFFHFVPNDHDLAEKIFPFRYLVRDTLSFLVTSRRHGGVRNFYAESKNTVDEVTRDRGYYFVAEQSVYPDNRLPDDFHLDSDNPGLVDSRKGDPTSPQLKTLQEIISSRHIQCYYVPTYARQGERAAPPEHDEAFAHLLAQNNLPCKVLGPFYFLYPNSYFSDQSHLNPDGAKVYTRDVFRLLSTEWSGGQ